VEGEGSAPFVNHVSGKERHGAGEAKRDAEAIGREE
jgi:hypothetical protein